MAVVDDQLRVRGIEGLRVADAVDHAEPDLGQHQRAVDHDRRKGIPNDPGFGGLTGEASEYWAEETDGVVTTAKHRHEHLCRGRPADFIDAARPHFQGQWQSAAKSGSHETPRWRGQSRAKPSPEPNSLLASWENTGNFAELCSRRT
jgi:hypothetical protein